MADAAPQDHGLDLCALTDVGTEREHNEDACATQLHGPGRALLAVADGVSGNVAGETASQNAVQVVLRAWAEQAETLAAGKRLYRAVQQANIEVHDLAIVVPELRGMATTLTAVAIDGDQLEAAHVGDSRLYLGRGRRLTQLSKDHTVVAERVRLGVLSERRAREHPQRSVLSRSLGRELIVAIDRITMPLEQGDVVLVCSDGLYNVLAEDEMLALLRGPSAAQSCQALINAANERGTIDNLTAAVAHLSGALPPRRPPPGLGARLRRLVGQ
jgi:protein phosphatase